MRKDYLAAVLLMEVVVGASIPTVRRVPKAARSTAKLTVAEKDAPSWGAVRAQRGAPCCAKVTGEENAARLKEAARRASMEAHCSVLLTGVARGAPWPIAHAAQGGRRTSAFVMVAEKGANV